MRLRLSLLLIVPLLAACGAPDERFGSAQDAITICPAGTTLEGIDVSHYDGTIDWAQVKASGRAFAFAKATEGTTYTDPSFAANWAGMKQQGIARSAYHFFHSNVDPTTEANHFLSVMGSLQAGDLPPTLDLEVTDNQSAATITANTITWLDTVAAATGTKPILYASPSFISGTLGSPAGLENHATLWVANWGVNCPDVPAPFTGFAFWQYSDAGTVPGISGSSNVDLDRFNGDLAALQALAGGGSSSTSSSSSSSGSSGPPCKVNGVDGTCIDVSMCAAMPGHMSTPGFCPGPATEQCCTPTGSSSSSSASSSAGSATTGAGGAATGTGGATTGAGGAATGAGGASAQGGANGAGGGSHVAASGSSGTGATGTTGKPNSPSGCGCVVAPGEGEDGDGFGSAWLLALGLVALPGARRARRSQRRP
jgi:lysozyme